MWKIFDNSPFAYWLLAFGQKTNRVRGEPWALSLCDLLLLGIGFGWPLGGPSVAQEPPKRHARIAQAWICGSALFATEMEKGWAGQNLSGNRKRQKPLTTKDTKEHKG
jgi:hypothetical protein